MAIKWLLIVFCDSSPDELGKCALSLSSNNAWILVNDATFMLWDISLTKLNKHSDNLKFYKLKY